MNAQGRSFGAVRRGVARTARWIVAVLGLVASVVPVPAALAQATAGDTPAWLRARLDNRLDARTRVAVERVIDSARAAGVPAEPLVDKALEGASKRAPGEAIVRAVRVLAADLAGARQVLGGQSLADELSAGAAALRAGVDGDALRRLRRDRPGQPLVVALGVLTDLIARGVPADDASRSVLALTTAGIADEQLVAFRRDVERDIGIGAPPAAAAVQRGSTLLLNLTGSGGARGAPEGRRRP